MTYTQEGDTVTLQMKRDDYDRLLLMMGTAAGAHLKSGDEPSFYASLRFVNELNATNPNFRPYELPPEFSGGTNEPGK